MNRVPITMKPYLLPTTEKWIEVIDEETNRSYFYSSVTGDREWDRPPQNARFIVRNRPWNQPGSQSTTKQKDVDVKGKKKHAVGGLEKKIEVLDSAIITTAVTNDCDQISRHLAEEAVRNEKGSNYNIATAIINDKNKNASEYNEKVSTGKDVSIDERGFVHILEI